MSHKFKKEVLHYFDCSECNASWSIVDLHKFYMQRCFDPKIFCPICGHKDNIEEKED